MKNLNCRSLSGHVLCWIAALAISCGADESLQRSRLKSLKPSSSATNLSSISMVRVNSFGRGLNVVAFPGRKVKSDSCLYSMANRLNVCVGTASSDSGSPEPSGIDNETIEDTNKPSLQPEFTEEDLGKGIFGTVDDELDKEIDEVLDLIDDGNKDVKAIDFALDQNRFEVGTYSVGVASLACLQPVSGPVQDRLYVFGAELPVHAGSTCFTNIACTKSKLAEVNVGMRICDPNITTEIALSYDAEKRKIGLYVKGSVDADDLNFRLLLTDQGVLLEYVMKELDSGTEIVAVNSLKLGYENLKPIVDVISDHLKQLGICLDAD